MTLSDHGRYISRAPVLNCRNRAVDDVFMTHQGQINNPVGMEESQYGIDCDTGTVILSVSPSSSMTWGMWVARVMGFDIFSRDLGRWRCLCM